ncbi:hypothetical protein F4779DRAFT_195703 [Xylariaceae sp. FL0662B]|nr:hypothetical protein F4779DRAFT_195703 [Xylariaceae sp. FL0662B]
MATRLLPRRPTTTTTLTPTLSNCAASPLPTSSVRPPSRRPFSHTPSRSANIIRRPRRPYTFTQLVQLSDGSTFTMRTTSPLALYKSTKDTRNHVLWQPNEKSLRNVEVDEAGRLAAFRSRFGRGWDAEKTPGADETDAEGAGAGAGAGAGDAAASSSTSSSGGGGGSEGADADAGADSLADLISGYSQKAEEKKKKTESASKKKSK